MSAIARILTAAITIVKVYESALAREAELLSLDRAKTLLFSDASHELRTPLTLILGPVDALMANINRLPPDLNESIRLLSRNAGRLHKLVDAYLALARMEAGRLTVSLVSWLVMEVDGCSQPMPLNMGPHVVSLCQLFSEAMDRAGLAYFVNVPLEGPLLTSISTCLNECVPLAFWPDLILQRRRSASI